MPLNHFRSPYPDDPLPFEIARIEEKPAKARSSKPNRHTFYELFYLTEGSGLHYMDQRGHLNRKLRFGKRKRGNKGNSLGKMPLKIVNKVGAIGDYMPKW